MSLAITHYDISDFNLENSYVTQLEGFEGLETRLRTLFHYIGCLPTPIRTFHRVVVR